MIRRSAVRGKRAEDRRSWISLIAPQLRRCVGATDNRDTVLFSRSAGYSSVFLWTVSSLTTATSVYRRAGFTLTETRTHELWGATRTEERYDLVLGSADP